MNCKKSDCFRCPYPDCINDYVRPIPELTEEQKKEASKRAGARQKALRNRRKEAGVCLWCGERSPVEGETLCVACKLRKKGYNKAWRERNGVISKSLWDDLGRCMSCGKPERLEGYKLCEKCYQNACNGLQKGRSTRTSTRDHIWSKYNSTLYPKKEPSGEA